MRHYLLVAVVPIKFIELITCVVPSALGSLLETTSGENTWLLEEAKLEKRLELGERREATYVSGGCLGYRRIRRTDFAGRRLGQGFGMHLCNMLCISIRTRFVLTVVVFGRARMLSMRALTA